MQSHGAASAIYHGGMSFFSFSIERIWTLVYRPPKRFIFTPPCYRTGRLLPGVGNIHSSGVNSGGLHSLYASCTKLFVDRSDQTQITDVGLSGILHTMPDFQEIACLPGRSRKRMTEQKSRIRRAVPEVWQGMISSRDFHRLGLARIPDTRMFWFGFPLVRMAVHILSDDWPIGYLFNVASVARISSNRPYAHSHLTSRRPRKRSGSPGMPRFPASVR